jgi:hypothetical protein
MPFWQSVEYNFFLVSFEVMTLWVQMIEPELAFADLRDDMACATAYLQYVVCYTPQVSLVLDWRK